MINTILRSISVSLNAEFGDKYTNYIEEVKQGLKEPCFFISCINPTNELFLGRRYFRSNQFCIQYIPKTRHQRREECNSVADRLYQCLEWITVCGHLTMGSKMHYEISDDVLSFFVNYDMYVYKILETEPMSALKENVNVKG